MVILGRVVSMNAIYCRIRSASSGLTVLHGGTQTHVLADCFPTIGGAHPVVEGLGDSLPVVLAVDRLLSVALAIVGL